MLTTRFNDKDMDTDVLFVIPNLSEDFYLFLEKEFPNIRKQIVYKNEFNNPTFIINLTIDLDNINLYSLKIEIEKRIQEFIKIRNDNNKKHITIKFAIPFIRKKADYFLQEILSLEEKYKNENILFIIYSDIGRPELEYSLLKSTIYKIVDTIHKNS